MSRLNVELYGNLLGYLRRGGSGLSFEVEASVFDRYPISSTIMSLAVPLVLRHTAQQRRRCDNFFAEMLPEGPNLRWLQNRLPPGDRDTYGLLRRYGKDSAGALVIHDAEDPALSQAPALEEVDGQQVRYLLEHMQEQPLANSPTSGRISLGGMQGKIVLARQGTSWQRTHNGYPSTHIVKPMAIEYPTMVYDEAYCMQLARLINLTDQAAWIEGFDGLDALVVSRYDRDQGMPGGRIHQEDMNQALGARGDQKYQEVGGKVTAKRIAQTLSRFGSDADVRAFAAQLAFAVAIGNLDAHAKNTSVLHLPDGSIRLAPAYDQVPLRHQNADGRMALAVGGEHVHANLTLRHMTAELLSWGCPVFGDEAYASDFVRGCLEACRDALAGLPLPDGAYQALPKAIEAFTSRLLEGQATGDWT